jgi:hypothetical protein
MSRRSAFNFMGVARKFGDHSATVALLPPTALYELASSTAEVQAEVERRVAAGELVSGDDVRTLKAQFNEIAQKAVDLAQAADDVREENRDLMANAHRKASEEAERKYGALIDDLTKRAALAEETAAASMRLSNAEANPQNIADPDNVVSFAPKNAGVGVELFPVRYIDDRFGQLVRVPLGRLGIIRRLSKFLRYDLG